MNEFHAARLADRIVWIHQSYVTACHFPGDDAQCDRPDHWYCDRNQLAVAIQPGPPGPLPRDEEEPFSEGFWAGRMSNQHAVTATERERAYQAYRAGERLDRPDGNRTPLQHRRVAESHAARLVAIIKRMRSSRARFSETAGGPERVFADVVDDWADELEALQAAPAEPETVLPSMHGFAAAPIERGETLNPYPDVAEPDRLQQAAWCGNSVYHDDYPSGVYDVRCKACQRSLLAIRTLVADLVPRAVSVDDALSSPMAAGLVLQLKAECEAQQARAEAAEQQIVDITEKLSERRKDLEYHADCRPNRRQAEAALKDAKELVDWRADVTAALQRPGGAFFTDVPQHIRDLVAQIAALTADRELIAEMLHDQEAANIVLMALIEDWTARAHSAEARIEELTAERNDV